MNNSRAAESKFMPRAPASLLIRGIRLPSQPALVMSGLFSSSAAEDWSRNLLKERRLSNSVAEMSSRTSGPSPPSSRCLRESRAASVVEERPVTESPRKLQFFIQTTLRPGKNGSVRRASMTWRVTWSASSESPQAASRISWENSFVPSVRAAKMPEAFSRTIPSSVPKTR